MFDAVVGWMFGFVIGIYLIALAWSIFLLVAYWKLFEKAGEPGWAVFVPFYFHYVLFKISFGNGWMFLALFVPIVNIVLAFALPFKLAEAFGKDIGYGFGLLFLSPFFYPILAFGDAVYVGAR